LHAVPLKKVAPQREVGIIVADRAAAREAR
jgi:hypothetical protein